MDRQQYKKATEILGEIEQLSQLEKSIAKSVADSNYMCKISLNGHEMKITSNVKNSLRKVVLDKIDSLNNEFKQL